MRSRSSLRPSRARSVAKTPRLARRSDSSTFSQTVRLTKTEGVWNFRPMPSPAISSMPSGRRSVAWPKIRRPWSGFTRPEMTSRSVVFPAPFGPITTRSSR